MKDALITSNEVRKLLGNISNTTLWRRVKDGTLPQPIKLGNGRMNYFKESWIRDIIDGAQEQSVLEAK